MSENIFIASGKEFDRDWLLDTIALNADAYAQNRLRLQPEKRNMWGKVKQSAFDVEGFHTALSDVTKAIAEGKLTRDAGNVYTHSDGIVWDDPSHRAALDLVNQSISAISSVEKPKYSNTRLLDRFNNKFYGGNFKGSESDYEIWKNGSKGINDIKALLDEEISDIQNNDLDYTGSAYKNKDEYLAKLQQLRTNLDNEVSESDLADWVALGGDGDFFRAVTNLKQPKKTIELENAERRQVAIELALREDPSLTREDAEAAYDSMILSRKKERELQKLKDTEGSDWDTYAANTFTSTANSKWSLNNYNSGKARGDKFWLDKTGEGSNEDTKGFLSTHSADVERVVDNLKRGIVTKNKIKGTDVTEDELLMASLHYNLQKHPDDYISAKDGSYIIKDTIKPDGTAYRYDPKKRTLYLYHADENTETLNKYFHDKWLKNRYKTNTRFKFKHGGSVEKLKALKALEGSEIVQIAKDNALKTKKEVEAKAKAEGKTYDLYRAAKRKVQKDGEFDLDTTTSLRLAGAASDIASAVAAFAPGYGTAVSGVLSLGGIGADLAADATDDSVTGWDMTKNLAVNLGIGLAGLIPVIGTSGKFAKAAKTVLKLAPTLLALGSTVAGYDQASNTIKKLANDKDVTVEEWTQLGRWIASAAGVTRVGAQALKTQAVRATANKTITEGETIKVKTTKGDVTLNADLKNLLISAKSPEEANGLLKTWFGDDAGNVKYDKSLLWKFWKGRQTSSELPITTTNETTTTYDLNTVPDLFGRRGLTKWGLSSDIDMLTGNGGLFGISKWRLSLPSSLNPYIRLKGTETIVKPVSLTTPTSTSTQSPTTSANTFDAQQRRFNAEVAREYNEYMGGELRGAAYKNRFLTRISNPTAEALKTLASKSGVKITNMDNFKQFVLELRKVNPNYKLMLLNPQFMKSSKAQFKFKQGGSINKLKELRSNFTQDNSQSSTGLSKFLHGGKPSGVQLSAGTTWLNDIFNVYKQDLLDKLARNGSVTADDINSMQDRHHKMYTDALQAGNWQSQAFTYGGDNTSIRDYQTDYDDPNKYGYNSKEKLDAIRQAYNKGRYTTTGTRTSGDGLEHSFKPDNLYSSITDDRRILGREGDWDENSDSFKTYQGELNKLGYEMYLDPNTKYYKLRPLSSSEKDEENASLKNPGAGMTGDNGGSPDNEGPDLSRYGDALAKITPELLSNYRFLKNLINNKKVRDLALKKEAALLSPIHKHQNIYGDYQSKILSEKLAADVMSKADRYAESTADLQAAALAKLEGLRLANELITKGHTADNTTIKLSIKEAKAVDDAVYDYNHRVGDENWSRLIAKLNADIDTQMAYNAANTTNWNNYLSEHEQRARINLNDQKQRQLALYKQRMSDWVEDAMKNDPEYIRMYNEYINPNTSAQRLKELLTEIANWLKTRMQEITPYIRKMTANYILGKNLDEIFDIPAGLFKATAAERRTQTAARGGRLTVDSSRMKYRADDLRELRKLIKHNIDTNRHALDNLSKATLLELKKMMGI